MYRQILLIYLFNCRYMGRFCVSTPVNSDVLNIVCKLLSILWSICPKLGVLCHMEILFLFFEELLYYFPLVTITLNTSLYSEPFPISLFRHPYLFICLFILCVCVYLPVQVCVCLCVCVYKHMNIRGQYQIYSPVVLLLIIETRLHSKFGTHHFSQNCQRALPASTPQF